MKLKREAAPRLEPDSGAGVALGLLPHIPGPVGSSCCPSCCSSSPWLPDELVQIAAGMGALTVPPRRPRPSGRVQDERRLLSAQVCQMGRHGSPGPFRPIGVQV